MFVRSPTWVSDGPWRIGEANAAVYLLKREDTPSRQCRGRAIDPAQALSSMMGIKHYARGLVIICRSGSDLTLGDSPPAAGKSIRIAIDTLDSIRQAPSGFAKPG